MIVLHLPTRHGHRRHSHSRTKPDKTNGTTLHQPWLYQVLAGPLLARSEKKIVELAGIKPGNWVLDVGCGPGILTRTAKQATPGGKVIGLDAAQEMVDFAQQQADKRSLDVDFRLGLAQELPFEDATFDVVISRLAIHHLPESAKPQAFAEMYRVLKPGGHCFIVDFEPSGLPFSMQLKRFLLGHNSMMQIDVANYWPMLEKAGFTELKRGRTNLGWLAWISGHLAEPAS